MYNIEELWGIKHIKKTEKYTMRHQQYFEIYQ